MLGALLLRSQGRAVWRRFNEALAQGRMPQREIQDGVAVIFGGAFLITPGFITDIFGLAAAPAADPGRDPAPRRAADREADDRPHHGGRPARPRHDYDVEGTATERPPAEPPHLQR